MKREIVYCVAAIVVLAIAAVCFYSESAEYVIRLIEAAFTFFLGLVARVVYAVAKV